jgi:hypothetical protein
MSIENLFKSIKLTFVRDWEGSKRFEIPSKECVKIAKYLDFLRNVRYSVTL